MHPRRGVSGAKRLRLDAGAHAGENERLGQKQASREETDERVYGVGASGAQEARGSVSAPPQRRAQQNSRQTLEVNYVFFPH